MPQARLRAPLPFKRGSALPNSPSRLRKAAAAKAAATGLPLDHAAFMQQKRDTSNVVKRAQEEAWYAFLGSVNIGQNADTTKLHRVVNNGYDNFLMAMHALS